MSTIVIIQQSTGVHLITDAGAFDGRTGAVVGIHSKVLQLHGNTVLAWRGAGGDWPCLLARQLLAYRSFDAMLCDLSERASELYASCLVEQGIDAPTDGYDIELYLAGPSRIAGRFGCAYLSSRPVPTGRGEDDAGPPFAIRDAAALAAFPGPSESLRMILGRDIGPDDIDGLDPAATGLH